MTNCDSQRLLGRSFGESLGDKKNKWNSFGETFVTFECQLTGCCLTNCHNKKSLERSPDVTLTGQRGKLLL